MWNRLSGYYIMLWCKSIIYCKIKLQTDFRKLFLEIRCAVTNIIRKLGHLKSKIEEDLGSIIVYIVFNRSVL